MNDPAGAVAVPLMLLVAALSVIARRFGVPSPMLMLVAGTAIAFVPGMPALSLTPAIVLLWLLPPLLYSSGVGMSWRGFRSSLRPIMLLAIGLVLATASAIAALAHVALGMPWAVGFVLGAIVSPPDAVAPIAILRALHLPRRLVTILEGESLVNDATALVTLSFATAAVVTGGFSFTSAVMEFVAILVGEIVLGIVVGWLMLRVRQFAADARAEVLLALATPYIAFWPAHAAGGSGVIACVASGLYVSWNGRRLIRPDTRLQGYFIWDLVVWATEAVIFFLAGLQAREVFGALGDGTWTRAVVAGVLVTLAVVVVRFAWVFAATYLPRKIFPGITRANPAPGWRFTFMIAFCGLRGAVSLVAALLVPATIDGQPFPERNVVLFATYCVVVFTLVGLGSALPAVARRLGIDRVGADEAAQNAHEEQEARLSGIEAAQRFLTSTPAPSAAEARALLGDELSQRRAMALHRREGQCGAAEMQDVMLRLEMIGVERAAISDAYEANHLTDEARRRIERELDLEEARLRQSLAR
jgi:CPA1 family monovalent cation:H+ antiporter